MKRIIEKIQFSPLDITPGKWYDIEFIPATATHNSKSKRTASGRLKTATLSFKVSHRFAYMTSNISILITWDNGDKEIIGTNDLPATLTINETDYISCSCEWEHPEI